MWDQPPSEQQHCARCGRDIGYPGICPSCAVTLRHIEQDKRTEHQRAQGAGNAQRGGRSCGVVALLLLSAATLGLAWPVFSLLGVIS